MKLGAEKYFIVPQGDKGLAGAIVPGSTAGKRIGIYGGSFNPPHKGHLLVAQTALERLKLDAVWWLVSPGNPLKDNSNLSPLRERIAAAEALINNPKIQVTGFEQSLAMQSSAPMLKFIVKSNAKTRFVWIMGADNLMNFHHWHEWRSIMKLLPIAVVNRPGFKNSDSAPAAQEFRLARLKESDAALLAETKPPAWLFLNGPQSRLSSSFLRKQAKIQEDKGNAIPEHSGQKTDTKCG